jgi:transcriptional regulator with XRE-family HTH domain
MVDTGVTQAALARAACTSRARISLIMSGRATTITVTAAAAIERALGVPHGTYFYLIDSVALVRAYIPPTRDAA